MKNTRKKYSVLDRFRKHSQTTAITTIASGGRPLLFVVTLTWTANGPVRWFVMGDCDYTQGAAGYKSEAQNAAAKIINAAAGLEIVTDTLSPAYITGTPDYLQPTTTVHI